MPPIKRGFRHAAKENASYTPAGDSAEAAVTRGAQGPTMSCTERHDEAMIGHSSAKRRNQSCVVPGYLAAVTDR